MSPRSPEANRAQRERAREAIMASAAKVFARRGYAGAKVADIAAAAGVSSGLVHHYFATKAEVFVALIERVMAAATQVPAEALERPGTPPENVRWMVDQMLLGAAHAPEYYVFALQVLMSDAVPEQARTLVAQRGADGLRLMSLVVKRAQEAGVARQGDPAILMTHVLAAVQGLAIQVAFSEQPTPGVPDVDVVLGMLESDTRVDGGRT